MKSLGWTKLKPMTFSGMGIKETQMMKRIKTTFILLLSAMIILSGCTGKDQSTDGGEKVNGYRQISQEEAKKMMELDDGHVIVDVRRQDEYDAGHIPGAILIPNESILSERPAELPDLEQIILVYCRSGRRSKEASQKLAGMGYTNVYEFGGIIDWTGETIVGKEPYHQNPEAEYLADLREKFPEYFDLGTFKGLEVYAWQMARDSYSFGVMTGTNRNKSLEEMMHLKGATASEMKAILSTYDIPKENIIVIPWQNPISSYIGEYWIREKDEDPAVVEKRREEYIEKLREMLLGTEQ